MSLSNDGFNFVSNFLTFLGFVGSFTVVLQYLDPWQEYLVLADITAEIRKLWTDYDALDTLPRGQLRAQLLDALESCVVFRVSLFGDSNYPTRLVSKVKSENSCSFQELQNFDRQLGQNLYV